MKDSFNRKIDYLRVSVTGNCNLRCFYCTDSNWVDKKDSLPLDELYKICDILLQSGIKKIRLTGGEPLLYKDIVVFIDKLIHHPVSHDLFITTNLHVPMETIKKINGLLINGINVSLDTLNSKKYKMITQYGNLDLVKKNLEHLKVKNIKTNTVILKNINDSEVEQIIKYTTSLNITSRFIECMETLKSNKKYFMPNKLIIQRLIDKGIIKKKSAKVISGTAAVYYALVGSPDKEVGFISPVTERFCSNCNRLRLTSDGRLYLCLFNQKSYDLNLLKKKEIVSSIQSIVKEKEIPEKLSGYVNMRSIGG